MDLYDIVNLKARAVWAKLRRLHPELSAHPVPTVVLNRRLRSTAGNCYYREQRIDLAVKFFEHSAEYHSTMLVEILPHELIHAADFILHGESEFKHGHGKTWCKLMEQYGLEPKRYHDMVLR